MDESSPSLLQEVHYWRFPVNDFQNNGNVLRFMNVLLFKLYVRDNLRNTHTQTRTRMHTNTHARKHARAHTHNNTAKAPVTSPLLS